MPTIISKRSSVAGHAPTAPQLSAGETAVNTADGYIYTKHADGSVKLVGTKASRVSVAAANGLPAGDLQTTLVSLNNAVGGGTNPIFSGNVTLGNAGTDIVYLNSHINANGSDGAAGKALISRGSSLSPEWGSRIAGLSEVEIEITGSNIDLSLGNIFYKTITGSITFTTTNIATSGGVNTVILELTNGGAHTITWPSNVKWSGGLAPELTASGKDVLGFITRESGTPWIGFVLGEDVK